MSTVPEVGEWILSAFAMGLARISAAATATVAVTVEVSDATGRRRKMPAMMTTNAQIITEAMISSIFHLLKAAAPAD